MKIAAVSDIHVQPNGADAPLIEAIKKQAETMNPDVFVIAGDVSNRINTLRAALAELKLDHATNLYVPGNHDIWFEEEKGIGSLEKYSRLIGEACHDAGFHYLPDEPYVCDSLGFVGSMGWADYSFARPELKIPEENYRRKEYRGATWFDVFNVDWDFTDEEATDLFNRKLEYDLSTLPKQVRHIVYVSHHLPFRELTVYKNRLPWDFFSAYMGSVKTGQILLRDGRVILSISGHSHIRNVVTVNGITAITVPLGYGRPRNRDYEALAQKAVAEIEVTDGVVELKQFVTGDICEGMPYVVAR
ncbi:MAG: metallophosphoesterase family protein [Candidatus Thorarchaeota archaeon]